MQDRFKYRAINMRTKEITYIDSFYWFEENGVSEIDSDNIGSGSFDEYWITQCTGLKDKNGKLIYEGDIVKNWDNLIYQIIWLGDCACFMVENIRSKNKLSIYALISLQNNLEIVGNIYENPELLEDNK